MSGFLAFDRDRVTLLARRLAVTLDDLDRECARLGDPAAASAVEHLGRAVDLLSAWPLRLGAVARCGALTELFSWISPAVGDGMVVVRDRLPVGSPADAALAAAVLADAFARLDLTAAPPAVLASLQRLLDDADPATVAAFLDEIGPSGLAAILSVVRLGLEATARADPLDSIDVPAAFGLVRTLGLGWASMPPGRRDEAWDEVCDDAELVVAAELLAGAAPRLGDDELAERATELLGRVADLDDSDPSAYWRRAGVSVLEAISARPHAARDTLLALGDDELSFVLLRLDPGATGAFAHAATDPGHLSATEAREPVGRLVEVIDAAGRSGPLFASPPDLTPGASVPADWWLHRESRFTPHDPRLPSGIGQTLGVWLPRLIEPIQIAGWHPADGAPVPWELDDDALSGALVELMANEADALALRVAAITYFAGALTEPAATLQHAAYALAAIEDSARAAGLGPLGAQAGAAAALGSLGGFVTTPLNPVASMLIGFGLDVALAPLIPDIRAAIASGEAAGFGFAASLGWIAVRSWRERHAPDAAPLPPLPSLVTSDATRPGDRADEGAGAVADAVEEWAETLTPEQRDEVIELYDRVQSAAAQGTGFSA